MVLEGLVDSALLKKKKSDLADGGLYLSEIQPGLVIRSVNHQCEREHRTVG
jgi:hypothetical protein